MPVLKETLQVAEALAERRTKSPVEGLLDKEGELPPEDAEDLAGGSIVHLWRLAVRRRLGPRRDDFLAEIRELAGRLRDRLEAEQAIEEAREPEHLEQARRPRFDAREERR